MNIKKFSSFIKRLFREIQIHKKTFILNGSFNDSYWAADIDMYQSVKDIDISEIYEKINHIIKKYIFLELKIVEDNGNSTKIFNVDDINKNIFNKSLTMVKVDFVIFLTYPIECSIIYDFDPERMYNIRDVLNDMLKDVLKYNVYKGIKRLNTIANIIGYKNLFDDVLQQTKFGALYLTDTRIELIDRIKDKIDITQYNMLMNSLIEDKRKNGLLTRNFNKEILQFLKKII